MERDTIQWQRGLKSVLFARVRDLWLAWGNFAFMGL